uniref:Putative transcription factor grauzone-like protein n=1 Tax=Lutzomyia longipalpis TaxID=7200 RepID=A0A1B0CLJ1_LUTLO
MEHKDVKEEFTSSTILCRLCLIQNSSYRNVFNDGDQEIISSLRILIGISIDPADNWPKTICMRCMNRIEDFQEFQRTAHESAGRLRRVFGEAHSEENKDITPHVGTAVFLSSGSGEDVKDEGLLKFLIKEEDTDASSDDSYHPFEAEDVEVKNEEEDEAKPGDSIKRLLRSSKRLSKTPPREQLKHGELKKRGRKRKTTLEATEGLKEEISEVEAASKSKVKYRDRKRKMVVSEEVDAAIHTFYKMECELCHVHYVRFADLQKHFRIEHLRRGYVVCCGKKLNSPKKLQIHMNNHKSPSKHECTLCQKNYKSEDTLLMHKKLQHTPMEERKFSCDICQRRFALVGALRRHMIVHVEKEDKKHVCKTCGQAFALANMLVSHIRRVHENACISICDICAKVYRDKFLFKKHMMEHRNELKPNVPCPVCGKLFTYRLAMKRHLRRHNTSGSLECHICRHVSANQQALREHIKLNHMERKLYECSLCEKIFKKRENLKEHMASHTGKFLYECAYCAKQFNNSSNYYSHKQKVHPVEWQAEREKRLAAQPYQKAAVAKDQTQETTQE